MTTERDPQTRTVLSWLRDDAHENAERVLLLALDEVDTTPQRRSWWPARRIADMNKLLPLAAAAAALLVVAGVGYNLLRSTNVGPPLPSQTVAPTVPTPSASPELSVTGSFISHGAQIELNASGQRENTGPALIVWSNVTGSLTATDVGGDTIGHFAVDLACARTSASGLIMLGGLVTDSKNYDDWAPVGDHVAIAIQPGSPVKALLHASDDLGCPTLLASMRDIGDDAFDWSALEPIDGTIDIKP